MIIPEELLLSFSDSDRILIQEEAVANPEFGRRLTETLSRPGGDHVIAVCAQQSILNELDPRLYPETKERWGVLRKMVAEALRDFPRIAEEEVRKIPFETKMRILRKIASGKGPVISGVGALAALGQFSIIGDIASSLIGAGSSILNARMAADAQKDLAKIQASAQQATVEAQVKIAEAQKTIAAAQANIAAVQAPASALSADIGGGIPLWGALAVGAVALGTGVYLIARR